MPLNRDTLGRWWRNFLAKMSLDNHYSSSNPPNHIRAVIQKEFCPKIQQAIKSLRGLVEQDSADIPQTVTSYAERLDALDQLLEDQLSEKTKETAGASKVCASL